MADIRCEAFYTPPCPTAQIPVRRREIYTAMRDRLRLGSKCLVVIDTKPPEEYDKFVTTEGLVVGSCDVSLHSGTTGKRYRFGVRGGRGGRKMYVSSMAVRAEWRRRGLAQRLLSYVDVVGGEYGVGEVFLHVEEENGVAVYVYGKCGYERVMCDVPRWVHFLAKREHKLLRKTLG